MASARTVHVALRSLTRWLLLGVPGCGPAAEVPPTMDGTDATTSISGSEGTPPIVDSSGDSTSTTGSADSTDSSLDDTSTSGSPPVDPADCINIDPQPGDPCYTMVTVEPLLSGVVRHRFHDLDEDGHPDLLATGTSTGNSASLLVVPQLAPGVFGEPQLFDFGFYNSPTLLIGNERPDGPPRIVIGNEGNDFADRFLGWFDGATLHELPAHMAMTYQSSFGTFGDLGPDELLMHEGEQWALHRWAPGDTPESILVPGPPDLGTEAHVGNVMGDARDEVVMVRATEGRLFVREVFDGPTFAPIPPFEDWTTLEGWPESLGRTSLADVTGDGHLDLILFGGCEPQVAICPGQGDGTFGEPVVSDIASGPVQIAITTVGADDAPYLITGSCGASPEVTVYPATARGIAEAWLRLPFSPDGMLNALFTTADVNGDGYPDFSATMDDGSESRLEMLLSHPEVDPLG